jgi:hypothetical protein
MAWGDSVRLAQHADQHRPERPVFLAVDQQLSEGATPRVAPELSILALSEPPHAMGVVPRHNP